MKRAFLIVISLLLAIASKCIAEETDQWILTQYYGGGSVGMFYSIVNSNDGTVILIDSGYPENAELVKSVIEANGGKVDYWFATHYHSEFWVSLYY